MGNRVTTRRTFLKRSAATTAALAAPFVWTDYARGAMKNDLLNVASIGTSRYKPGTWGQPDESEGQGARIGHLAGQIGNMVAVADVNSVHAGRFASKYDGKCKVYRDYRRMLDKEQIDAVTVGTPDHWHTKISIDAMRSGRDVYCEKPLTLTIDEGKLLCKIAKQTGAVLQVGTQQRSNPYFLMAAAICRSGRLGKKLKALSSVGSPDFVEANTSHGPFPNAAPPSELDWDMWLGQAPKVPYCPQRCNYDFRWWLEYSGGQVTDWGVHHTDVAVWALGLDHTGPVEIDGTGTFPNVEGGYNVAETFDVTMKYAGGHEIRLYSGTNELIFSGEKGRIRVNRGGLTGKPVEVLTEKDRQELDEIIAQLCRNKPPGNHMQNFFDCIKDRTLPIADVYSHHRAVTCCHLANIALRLDRPLRWDPVKEKFLGDAGADAMLGREQRKPYALEA